MKKVDVATLEEEVLQPIAEAIDEEYCTGENEDIEDILRSLCRCGLPHVLRFGFRGLRGLGHAVLCRSLYAGFRITACVNMKTVNADSRRLLCVRPLVACCGTASIFGGGRLVAGKVHVIKGRCASVS